MEINWNGFNPLKLAVHHENPVKFIIDHRSHWGNVEATDCTECIEFLTAKPENFKEPDVMNILSDLIHSSLRNQSLPTCFTTHFERIKNANQMRSVIEGICKTQDIPELQERAINLLVYAGSYCAIDVNDIHIFHTSFNNISTYNKNISYQEVNRRSIARKALNKLIHDPQKLLHGSYTATQIQTILQEMLVSEPLVQLKIELLNRLEQVDHIADKLDGEIIRNLSLTWDINRFIDSKGNFYDEGDKKTRDIAFHELLQLIQSEERAERAAATMQVHSKSLKIVAIRYFSNYFNFNILTEYLVSCDNMKYLSSRKSGSIDSRSAWTVTGIPLQLIREQQAYRKTICQFLIKSTKDEMIDADLRAEAASLLSMIVTHLQFVEKACLPFFELMEEVPKLLNRIAIARGTDNY